MTYRPFPDRERALHQLDRHHAVLPPSEFQRQFAEQARVALDAAGREMRPFAEGTLRLAEAAPTVLAQTAPAAHRFIAALRQRAQVS